jgi:hypothetical protein
MYLGYLCAIKKEEMKNMIIVIMMLMTVTISIGGATVEKNLEYSDAIGQGLGTVSQKSDTDSVALMKIYKEATLGEFVVKGNRPLVKVENGMLNYNLSVLTEKKAVDNVYDAIAALPGISDKDGTLALAGASGVTVIMNGRPTTMTSEQLAALLHSMPVDRVEKVEVMYSAPPQYHVRGAVINIVMRRTNAYSFQGEVKGTYKNRYFNSYGGETNFRMSTPKMAFDLMYGLDNNKSMQHFTMNSHHLYQKKTYDISQTEWGRYQGWDHSLRATYEYNISDKSKFNIAYTTFLSPGDDATNDVTGNYQTSRLEKNERDYLHNVSAAYLSDFGLKLGADYTNYHSVNRQYLQSVIDAGNNEFHINGGQNVRKMAFTADQEHQLKRNWTFGYGISYENAFDKDNQYYTDVKGSMQTANTDTRITEQTTDFYLSVSKNYVTGPSFSLSASGEYYAIGGYYKWTFYPQASFTYFKTPKHVFILSFSSDKSYPSYWEMQSSVTHLDGYQEVRGSSDLRPFNTYKLTATYVLNRKCTLTAFYEDMRDYFTQSMYQSSERLALIFQTRNWNFNRQYGLVANAPFKIGSWLNSEFSVLGLRMHQKCDDYFDIPFDRAKWLYQLSMDNTFTATKNLSFELNGMYTSPLIQGTYDLTHLMDVSASAKWRFGKDKCTLTARLSDIFNAGLPKTKVNYANQNFDMNTTYYLRSFMLSFSYRFGGYKEMEHKKVDTSRFGH